MNREKTRESLLQILNTAPVIKNIMLSDDGLDDKRDKIRSELTALLAGTFDDNPTTPPLEWILKREAIRTFLNILSKRSERLAEFSFLEYVDRLIHPDNVSGAPKPSNGFLAEFEHLIKGLMGAAGIYPETAPAFAKRSGAAAARLRSNHLSKMAVAAEKFMDRYTDGLSDKVRRKRSRNKTRILRHFNATELEWGRWNWHVRHIIRDAETLGRLIELTVEERRATELAREYKIPFGITPYYLSLMDRKTGGERDRAVRAQVIPSLHYVNSIHEARGRCEQSMDFMLERDTSPIEGITRRYPMIVILKPILTCPQICVYCQRNWEIEDVYSSQAVLSNEKLEKAIAWIAERPEIKEVLITGGDPLLLSDKKIEKLLSRVSRIKHIDRIRIGTRTPVTLPQRITEPLVRTINRYHHPGQREIIIITHYEHQYEVTPESTQAIQKFKRYWLDVYNQHVYTFYNSRKFEAADLRHKLRMIGVTPYYTFNAKGKEETLEYRVPIARLLQEQAEEARLLPGTVRTDEIVFNVPGLGKNYLKAEQHHDVIAILPDGRRVYEFHPWEKKLALVDTYVYTDVSIYDYLQRLKKSGEMLSDYKTIWYYY